MPFFFQAGGIKTVYMPFFFQAGGIMTVYMPFFFQAGGVNHPGYKNDFLDQAGSTSIVFSMKESVGCLSKALRIFEVRNMFGTIIRVLIKQYIYFYNGVHRHQ